MKLIRANLADDVDLVRAEAIFRGVGFTLNLEFLNGILGQDHGRRIQRCVGIDQPVKCVIVGGRTTTINTDGVTLTLPHLALLAVSLHGTRPDKQQGQEVASVQR